MKLFNLILSTCLLILVQQVALASSEVVCSWRSDLEQAGRAPSLVEPDSINDRIKALEKKGYSVNAGNPTVSTAVTVHDANLAVSQICVTLQYSK